MTPSLTARKMRRDMHLTIREMASVWRVDPSTIEKLEAGVYDNTPDLIPLIEFQWPWMRKKGQRDEIPCF